MEKIQRLSLGPSLSPLPPPRVDFTTRKIERLFFGGCGVFLHLVVYLDGGGVRVEEKGDGDGDGEKGGGDGGGAFGVRLAALGGED